MCAHTYSSKETSNGISEKDMNIEIKYSNALDPKIGENMLDGLQKTPFLDCQPRIHGVDSLGRLNHPERITDDCCSRP